MLNKLMILNESFGKEGSDEKVEGLTLILDGTIKIAFDNIRTKKNYSSNNKVLRDLIFAGLETVMKEG